MRSIPTISVVIPCYNAESFLRETIDSALSQTHPPKEVIVVNDESTDGSAAIAESYGPPVRVIHQRNQGETASRNTGMAAATGDWIALLDADDLWVPNKLERQLAALKDAPEDIVCVYSDRFVFGSVQHEHVSRAEWHAVEDWRVRMLATPPVGCIEPIFPTSLGQKIGFPPGIADGGDRPFFMLLRGHGRFLRVPEPLAGYRKHPAQRTALAEHGILSVEALWNWLKANPDCLNADETESLRHLFAEQIIMRHDNAFWRNNTVIVSRAREMYRVLMPSPAEMPPLMRSDGPTWTAKAAYFGWNGLLSALPRGIRSRVHSMSAGVIRAFKRSCA